MTETAPIDDAAALTRHIETRYHQRHRQQLPMLAKMAEMVQDLHTDDGGAPHGLAGVLHRMIGELEIHMKEEELILFPGIREGHGARLAEPIAAMRVDHDEQNGEAAEIRRLTEDLTLPPGACSTWTNLYEGLTEFLADLDEHIRLENDVLFPQFEEKGATCG